MKPYTWVSGPVPATELAIFTADDMEKLVEVLAIHGYDPEAERGGRGALREYVPTEHDDSDPFAVVKAAALADLPAWVPAR